MSFINRLYKGLTSPDQVPIHIKKQLIRHNPLLFRKYIILKNKHYFGYDAVADPLKLVIIDPNNIKYMVDKRFGYPAHEKWGVVLGGDWDQDVQPFSSPPHAEKVESLIDRFENDKPWEDTSLYKKYTNKFMSHESAISHLQRYDKLFYDMQGRYKTSFELPHSEFMEEICVCIGRDGEVIYGGSGRHRLTLAKILDLNEIPVRVMARHKQWQKIREECLIQIKEEKQLTGKIKEFIDHPDLNDIQENQITGSFS